MVWCTSSVKASLIIHPPLSAVGFTLKPCEGSENRCTHKGSSNSSFEQNVGMASWCIPHALEERHQSPEAQSERCREEGGQGRLQGGPWIQSGPAVDTHRGLGIQRTILSLTRERFHVNFTVLIPFLLILSKAGKQYSSIRSWGWCGVLAHFCNKMLAVQNRTVSQAARCACACARAAHFRQQTEINKIDVKHNKVHFKDYNKQT